MRGVVRKIWWWTHCVVRWQDACYVEGALHERWRDYTALRGKSSTVMVMPLIGVVQFVSGWAGLVTSACSIASGGEVRVRWHMECRTRSDGAALGEGGCASGEFAFWQCAGKEVGCGTPRPCVALLGWWLRQSWNGAEGKVSFATTSWGAHGGTMVPRGGYTG